MWKKGDLTHIIMEFQRFCEERLIMNYDLTQAEIPLSIPVILNFEEHFKDKVKAICLFLTGLFLKPQRHTFSLFY